MSSLLKAFKEFYNEINGATLTGAIDVIVVEQADGTFVCSPFHVRFGKLGVLRCREKIVDIEVNGEPVNIHMKLGESGEAFFVQECHEHDLDKLPANLTTSPLPSEEFTTKYDDRSDLDGNESIEVKLRRNSIVGSLNDKVKIYENQQSDYTTRRYSEKVLNRRSHNETKVEYTTEQIRMELAEKEALYKPNLISNIGSDTIGETVDKPHSDDVDQLPNVVNESKTADVITSEENQNIQKLEYDNTDCDTNADNIGEYSSDANKLTEGRNDDNVDEQADSTKGSLETKSKKRRRKRSMMKKKSLLSNNGSASNAASVSTSISNTPRKNSSSSSLGSMSTVPSEHNDMEAGSNVGADANLQSSNATSILTDDFAKSDVANTANDKSSYTVDVQDTLNTPRMCDFHFFSDTEVAASPYGSRPSTPIQSDSEFEISQRDSLIKNEKNSDPMTSSTASWKWGEFPITPAKTDSDSTPMNKEAKQAERNSTINTMLSFMKETMKKRKSTSEGVYLSDLMDAGLAPEIVDKYFPPRNDPFGHMHEGDDRESGNGTSIPQSPNSIANSASKCIEFDFEGGAQFFDKNIIALSLCGGLERGGPTDDEFNQNIIDYADVSQNPSIFGSPLLVVRFCDKYYAWSTACSIVMTALVFRKPLPNSAIEQLNTTRSLDSEGGSMKQNEADNDSEHKNSDRRSNTGGYSWWKWRRSTDSQEKKSPLKDNDDEKPATDGGSASGSGDVASSTGERKQSTFDYLDAIKDVEISDDKPTEESELISTEYQVQDISSDAISATQLDDGDKHDDSITAELDVTNKKPISGEKYRKTLRLTSEQIESLNLKPGMNELEFSVTTAYQGTSRCKCYVFRWRHTDKVVISDIDGTITKSDVLGHILPMVGKDWAQLGVAELFTKIEKNGYKLLYLSARAIGQSRATRDYLRSIQQGNVKLPDGPLLLNPTSLISAFHREVIEKKPEEFKIACLSDIKALFPENPFYAGYGNRINDVWAYCAVGIPVIRIFTINPKGELKHELNKTFQSTYHNMAYIVDQYFPPINDREESVEFSSFNYWREPILDIDSNCDDLIGLNTSTSSSNLSRMQQTSPVPISDDLSTIVDKV